MLKIGIDARLPHYRVGGISTYVRQLVNALAEIDKDNQYQLFHLHKADETLSSQFQRQNLWTPAHHRIERYALSVELLRHGLDVFHSPDFIPPIRGAKRHIITVHDLTFLHYPQYLTADSRRYYNDQIDWAVGHADHILAVSQSAKDDLMTMLNVPESKITVQLNGVDKRFHPLDTESLKSIKQKLNLADKFILMVGTLEPRKNILGLLRAYQALLTSLPDAPPIVLVGRKGWLFDETQAEIEQMNLSERILWRENVTDEQLPAVYNLATVLVLPSFYEGFGLPALEAMACGTVPIVSNRSSLPEIVGDVGLQINPDDPATITYALEKALLDKEWRAEIGQRGIERAKQFTWERSAKIALEVYQSVR